MKQLSFIASIASILSFFLSLLLLHDAYRTWGYIVAGASFLVLMCSMAYMLGSRTKRKYIPLRILENRDEMLEAWPYREMILQGTSPLLVLGGTLRSFVTEAHLDWIKESIRHTGRQVRILVMNPASQGSYLRAREENRLPRIYDDLSATISALVHFQDHMLSETERSRVEIRKYAVLPSASMFIKGTRAAYTHYLQNRSATSSPWYLLERDATTETEFQKIVSHYEEIWKVAIPISVPDNYAILFFGLPGVGKTTTAKIFANELLGSTLVSSEVARTENTLLDIFSDTERATLQNVIKGKIFHEIALGKRRLASRAIATIRDRCICL